MNQADVNYLPKVSIHMINYNQGDYLTEAIEGALAQDYPNFEIVIADDASTDGTAQVIADYAKRYPGKIVPVFNPRNLGITGNSNTGLRACSGELIAFTDSDDLLLPGKISTQVAWFGKDPRRVLCGHQSEVFYDDASRPPHPLSPKLLAGTGAEALVRDIPFGKTSIMVRADRLPAHGFEESLRVVSDMMMYVEVVREDGRFGFVEGIFARYRRHQHNVTRDPLKLLNEYELYLRIVEQRFPRMRAAVKYAATRRTFYDIGVLYLQRGQLTEAREKFVASIRREPWFARAWVRLIQTWLGGARAARGRGANGCQ